MIVYQNGGHLKNIEIPFPSALFSDVFDNWVISFKSLPYITVSVLINLTQETFCSIFYIFSNFSDLNRCKKLCSRQIVVLARVKTVRPSKVNLQFQDRRISVKNRQPMKQCRQRRFVKMAVKR